MIPRDKFSYEYYKPERNPRFCNLIGLARLEESQINLSNRELKNWVLCLRYLFFIDYLDDTYWLYWLFRWYILASKKQIFRGKSILKQCVSPGVPSMTGRGKSVISGRYKGPKRQTEKSRENVLGFFSIGSLIYSYC